MNDFFDVADKAAGALQRRLLRQGIPPEIIADAFATAALGSWAARTGHHQIAASIIGMWSALREATDAE